MNEVTYRISLAFISQSSRAKMRTTERRSSDDDRHSRWFMLSLYPSLADRIIPNDGQLTSQGDTTRQSWLRNRQLTERKRNAHRHKTIKTTGKSFFLLLFLNLIFLFFLYFVKETVGSLVITSAHSRRRPSTHSKLGEIILSPVSILYERQESTSL